MIYSIQNFIKSKSSFSGKNKIKITILGKWYDLPGRAVDVIKSIIEETKDYDSYFINFCVNYNGQTEIVDACRLIAKQVELGKLSPDKITKGTIKDNIYTSYFISPDLIIRYGKRDRMTSFLLWDSINSLNYFPKKDFPETTQQDFIDAIKHFQNE